MLGLPETEGSLSFFRLRAGCEAPAARSTAPAGPTDPARVFRAAGVGLPHQA